MNRLDGVTSVDVNIATNKARIVYQPSLVRISEIKQAVIKAGYTPLTLEKQKEMSQNDNEQKKMWRDLILAMVFTIPLLFIAMGPMIKLPTIPLFNPKVHPRIFALVQLALTLPVVYIGRSFYSKGFKALYKRLPNMDSLIAVGTTAAIAYSTFGLIMILQGDRSEEHTSELQSQQ